MPAGFRNCSITFPESVSSRIPSWRHEDSGSGGRGKGLLVQINRLNVPCGNGGYLKFVGSAYQRLCGKLEEIPIDDRTYYFKENVNTTIGLVNRPQFSVSYRVVDFCYNTTLTDRNHTFFLQPSSNLDCYFKIHLPYGFRIKLEIVINLRHRTDANTPRELTSVDNNGNLVTSNNEYREINYPNRDKIMPISSDLNFNSEDIEQSDRDRNTNRFTPPGSATSGNAEKCDSGLAVQLFDSPPSLRWSTCFDELSTSKRITLLSSENVMVLKVVNKVMLPSDKRALSQMPSLFVEYSAQSVDSFVSQCAFGWFAFQQFCLTAVHDMGPLTWYQAEHECVRQGGHLASIRSKQQQSLLDQYLIRRYSERSVVLKARSNKIAFRFIK